MSNKPINYHVLPSYLDDEIIEELLALPNESGWIKGAVGHDDFQVFNPSIRSVDRFEVDPYYNPMVYSLFDQLIRVFNARSNSHFAISGVSQIDLLRYHEGGHYDFHFDSTSDHFPGDRKISCIAQLSDPNDYEGGDFQFMNDNAGENEILTRRGKGSVILFDSRMVHTISPVTSGKRMSVIAWGTGRL
jgi:predicted 2-oxoglutarate/Fe(II)-dependent dioxygenase YbiX